MTTASRPLSPWTARDAGLPSVAVLLGGCLAITAWTSAAGRAAVEDQFPFVALGVVGLVLALTGQAFWLFRGRRAVGRRARHLLGRPPGRPARSVDPGCRSEELVAAPGLLRFHRADCPAVIDSEVHFYPTTLVEAQTGGLVACGVCRPPAVTGGAGS